MEDEWKKFIYADEVEMMKTVNTKTTKKKLSQITKVIRSMIMLQL